jgi:hypothetical protein
MGAPSQFYTLGTRPCPVIVTIEPIGDISLTEDPAAYQSLSVKSGKIIKIADASGKIPYEWANLKFNGEELIKVSINQYFITQDPGLTCYYHKCAVVEHLDPERLFSGVKYKHYSNGKLQEKIYYANGVVLSCTKFRDDIYNSMCTATMYKHGKPELINTYDEREWLMKQEWLMQNGKKIAEHVLSTGSP